MEPNITLEEREIIAQAQKFHYMKILENGSNDNIESPNTRRKIDRMLSQSRFLLGDENSESSTEYNNSS